MRNLFKLLFSTLTVLLNQHGAFTRDELSSLGNDFIDEVSDGIFSGDAVLKRFRANQKIVSGGNQIKAPLMITDDTGSTGGFYSPRDDLSLDEYTGLSSSLHDWKYLEETLVLYNADLAKNSGKEGIVDLLESRSKIMENAFRQRMLKGIYSDGTASTGALDTNQFDGFAAIIASSGSYAGIDPADLASWISTVTDSIGTLTLEIVDNLHDQATEPGKGSPSMGVFDKSVFTIFKALLTAQQRTTADSSLDGFGHKGAQIVYNGIPHFVDNQSVSGEFLYIDEDHARLYVQKDNNLRRESYDKLETKDAMAKRLFLYAQLVASQRKFHAAGKGITT